MTISTRAQDVRDRRPQAKIGAVILSALMAKIDLFNDASQANQSDTITIDTAADDTDYTVTIDGIDVVYTSGTGATTTSIATGLSDAINAEPLVRGKVAASAAAAVVTLEGTYPGISYTLAESDANLSTASVTSAADASAIEFGRLVVSTGFVTDEAYETGALAASSQFTAQVDTILTPFVATAEYHAAVTVEGATYHAQVTADTDADTTGAALAAALNDILPADTVIAAGAAGGLTLTAEVAGLEFSTTIGASDDGATVPAVSLTSTVSASTSLARATKGVSLYSAEIEAQTVAGDDPAYPGNSGVKALSRGLVWVESTEAPSAGDPVYVEMSGADAGRFYATDGATRIRLEGASWVRDALSGDDLALLRVAF